MSKGKPMSVPDSDSPATPATPRPTRRSPGSWWAYAPAGLLLFLMSIVSTMVVISTNDPGFAVEPNYYEKAVSWDEQRAQLVHNDALGWTTQWELADAGDPHKARARLQLRLVDRTGTPIMGAIVSIQGFHNARASQIQHLGVRETGGGRYEALVEVRHAGLWEFRLHVAHQGQVYTEVHRVELSALASQPHARLASSRTSASGPDVLVLLANRAEGERFGVTPPALPKEMGTSASEGSLRKTPDNRQAIPRASSARSRTSSPATID